MYKLFGSKLICVTIIFCYHYQALGCLFYEMIALKPAFDANNLISLFYKIVKGDFEVSGEHSILMRMFREKHSGLRFPEGTSVTHDFSINLSLPSIII